MKPLKVKNTSDFWYFHDEYDFGEWYFPENKSNGKDDFVQFMKSYISLTNKYGMLISLSNDKNYIPDTGISGLYETNCKGLYKNLFISKLFIKIDNEIVLKEIKDFRELNSIDNNIEDLGIDSIIKNISNNSIKYQIPSSYIVVKTDALSEKISFNSTDELKYTDELLVRKGSLYGIDNSELAYLNTPRFNSFLRDLGKLYESFGSKIVFDSKNPETSEYGILLGGDIVYYEDIVDILEEEYRIVDLSIDTNFFNKNQRLQNGNDLINEKGEQNKKDFDQDFDDFLNNNYSSGELSSWKQFYENFVLPAFNMDNNEYSAYLKNIRCPFGFIGSVEETNNNHNTLKTFITLDEDVKKTIALILSGNLLQKKQVNLIEWLNLKEWNLRQFDNHQYKSILEIASHANGNNFIRNSIMEMPIFKIF